MSIDAGSLLAEITVDAIRRAIEGPKVAGRIAELKDLIVAQGKQLEEARTEINFLRWAREQERAKG